MTISNDQLIIFDNVSKFYGEILGVNRVNSQIAPGITSLVGPNGAGKSTLMNLMTGLLRPTRGKITLLGIPTDQQPAFFQPPKRIMSRWSTGILRTCSASCATHPNRSCTDLLNSCRLSECCWARRLGNGERRVTLSPNHRVDKCAVLAHQKIGRHRWDTRARQNHPGEVQWVCG